MRKPNFFIVGAPKCGTTALRAYLKEHRQIFFCEPKEPNYFATDFPTHRYVIKEEEYLNLFSCADENVTLMGEASGWYLYSQEAIKNIREFNSNSKIIVMVRNPLDMFPSLHGMLLRNFAENEPDLERAWDLQESRRANSKYLRRRNNRFDPRTCLYADVCKLGLQVEKLFNIFPKHQVHVILFDEFVRETESIYRKTLNFLGVQYDGRKDFPAHNIRRSFKSNQFARVSKKFRDVGSGVKRRFGIYRTFNVLERLNKLNEKSEPRPVLSSSFRERLLDEFGSDIEKLSNLVERDLIELWNLRIE